MASPRCPHKPRRLGSEMMNSVGAIARRVRVSTDLVVERALRAFEYLGQAGVVALATALVGCSVANSVTRIGPSRDERLGERVAERSVSGPGKACRREETVSAEVDGDKLRDRVYHAWIRGGPVLGVCTGDGRTDQMPGSGMSELLRIIDVQNDGATRFSMGGTTVSAEYFDVAVFRRGKLRQVLRPKGTPLLLIKGTVVDPDRGKAFGCLNTARGKGRKLVKASDRRTSGGPFKWTRASFRLEDASAKRILIESGRAKSGDSPYTVAANLVKPC